MSSICGVFSLKGGDKIKLQNIVDQMSVTMKHRGESFTGVYPDSSRPIDIMRDGDVSAQEIEKGYRKHGIKVLEKVHGAFALSIWDADKQILYIARDRIGIKPLYYYQQDDHLFFSSELKGLTKTFIRRPAISQDALGAYMAFKYVPEPLSIYDGVFKLEKGQYLHISAEGGVQLRSYHDARAEWRKIGANKPYDQYQKILRDKLFAGIEKYMSKTPQIGVFLSGGIDSSIVTGIMSKLSAEPVKTYSINYMDKEFDESYKSNLVSKLFRTEHTAHVLECHHVLEELDRILLNYDEPFADYSAIPSYYVAKLAAADVELALTGDGADEMFGGYNAYEKMILINRYNRLPKGIKSLNTGIFAAVSKISGDHKLIGLSRRLGALSENTGASLWSSIRMTFSDQELSQFVKGYQVPNFLRQSIERAFKELSVSDDLADKMMYSDQCVVLNGNMTVKMDRVSMLCSLDTAAPFLDDDLVAFSRSIPSHYKIQGHNKKRILKDTFADMLPPEIMTQKKQGFGVPVGSWLFTDLRDDFLRLISREFIEEQGLFDYEFVKNIADSHFAKDQFYVNEVFRPWTIYVFQKWYERIYMNLV